MLEWKMWTLQFVTELNKVHFVCFKVLEIFWINSETIIEFGFRSGFHMIWRIMQISEGVIRPSRPSSIYIILQPHPEVIDLLTLPVTVIFISM